MKKYEADCTYCIPQMCNIYPDRRKNRMTKNELHTYIAVDTEKEKDFIEVINYHMKMSLTLLHELLNYIETEKS